MKSILAISSSRNVCCKLKTNIQEIINQINIENNNYYSGSQFPTHFYISSYHSNKVTCQLINIQSNCDGI